MGIGNWELGIGNRSQVNDRLTTAEKGRQINANKFYQVSTVNYQLSTINDRLSTIDYQLLRMDATEPLIMDTATFGMGCFWSPDAQLGILEGVVRTRVGYAGGTTENPNYYNIGNHIEVVQIDFDRTLISYSELLNIFWKSHNPRQLPTWSRQYMDAVFYCGEEQAELARSKLKSEQAAGGEIYTLVEPMTAFYLAEDYHQKYYLRQETELMKEFDRMYDRAQFIDSTVAARVNGYIAGCGSLPALKAEIKEFGLSAAGCEKLEKIVSKNRRYTNLM